MPNWFDRLRGAARVPRVNPLRAVDLIAVVARDRSRLPQRTVGDACRRYFDFVKDDYVDGHVHADLRNHTA